jgi:hypothetical protein
MVRIVKRYVNGGLDASPPAIKSFFDSTLTIEKTVDAMEEVLRGMQGTS